MYVVEQSTMLEATVAPMINLKVKNLFVAHRLSFVSQVCFEPGFLSCKLVDVQCSIQEL